MRERRNVDNLFETELLKIGDWSILRLPENASAQLPSRGLALVEGMINGFHSENRP